MRWEQIAGRLACALLFALPWGQENLRHDAVPTAAARSQPSAAAGDARGLEAAPLLPMSDIRRVALILPETSRDAAVVNAVAAERAMRSRRRRPSLFALKPAVPPQKPLAASPALHSGSQKPAARDFGKGRVPQLGTSSLSSSQLHAIAETLFLDALVLRLTDRLNVQIVSDADTTVAIRALNPSFTGTGSGRSAAAFCQRLKCDAVLIPRIGRVRTRETEARVLSIWASVRLIRAGPDANAMDARARSSPPVVDYPAAGSAHAERVPFQDRFLKEWPQLAWEAARQAAAVAARTLATGVTAPFAHDGDRVAITPVVAPAQADALIYHLGGRTVVPAALQHLPTDVSGFYHPDLLPLFPDALVGHESVQRALSAEKRAVETLWSRTEMPEAATVAALGRRLNVQYVLLARVADLEVAADESPSQPGTLASPAGPDPAGEIGSGRPAPRDTATAEAIGALFRVADGVVLWRGRTTATTTARIDGKDPEKERRRVAFDAIRFSLLQLERRFRQYRLGFE